MKYYLFALFQENEFIRVGKLIVSCIEKNLQNVESNAFYIINKLYININLKFSWKTFVSIVWLLT